MNVDSSTASLLHYAILETLQCVLLETVIVYGMPSPTVSVVVRNIHILYVYYKIQGKNDCTALGTESG